MYISSFMMQHDELEATTNKRHSFSEGEVDENVDSIYITKKIGKLIEIYKGRLL